MKEAKTIAVTGAYSYSGKYMARQLLEAGYRVITLTSKTEDPFEGRVAAFPFHFDEPDRLAETLRGVDTLINTYWVRYEYNGATYAQAMENTRALFRAAKAAGVRRIVHVSIANPSLDSPLPYYSGKAQLEADLKASGIPHTILRPTVIFGREDILINNIAWFLRRLPVFGVPGDGTYRMQPIYVEDMAALAVRAVEQSGDEVIDATGPETYSFNELLRMLRDEIGGMARTMHLPPMMAYQATRVIGLLVGDVIMTRGEVMGLMDGLLATDAPPAGQTKLSAWVRENRETLGARYANEVKRHFVETSHEREIGR
jgi:NADH dehydrogenase